MKIILCEGNNLMIFYSMHGSGEQKTENNAQTEKLNNKKNVTNSEAYKSFFLMSNMLSFISIERLFYVE